MQRIHELSAQYFDGKITQEIYRLEILKAIVNFTDDDVEQFNGLFIANNG